MNMKYGQEPIREALIKYCNNKGVKYVHIAHELNLSKGALSHFVKGDTDMRRSNFDNLVSILQQVGYLE